MIFYDKEHLLEIIQAFYTLSGIRTGLLYTNTQEFFSYPEERCLFCSMVRSKNEIDKKCMECDLLHMEKCKKLNAPIVYTCHLGLTEVIAPLKENNVIICYFMFGQIVIDEFKEQSRLLIYNNIKEAGFEDKTIHKAIDKISSVSGSKLNASVKIFEAIISRIFSTKLIKFSKMKFINHLNSFIDAHISEKILVKDIYEHLKIRRTSLYECSKNYLDCGLSEYILNRKIDCARNLLQNPAIKIGEVSEKVGFTDYNYFTRVFRSKTGISPRAYRKEMGN
jgi:AraC-like DNA-binding protein